MRKGTIFITAMILAFLMVVVAGGLYRMVVQDIFMIRYLRLSTQAQYLAEAGINEVIYLLDQDFANLYNKLPLEKDLDEGKFIRVTKSESNSRILLTSVGTIGTISRTVEVEIENPMPPILDYAIGSAGDSDISSLFSGNVNITGKLHSNDDVNLTAWWNGAIKVTGDVNAVNQVNEDPGSSFWAGTINIPRPPNENVVSLDFPRFNQGYYLPKAISGGIRLNGDQVFNSQPPLSPANGIVFVQGSATFIGTNTLNGVLLATRDININGTLNQTQFGNYPALISQRDINILSGGCLNANGLVYAEDNVRFTLPGNCTINGLIIAQGEFSLDNWVNTFTLNFVSQPATPGIILPGGTPRRVTVLSWNR